MKGTYLDYHRVICNLPKEWRKTIDDSTNVNIFNTNICKFLLDWKKTTKGSRRIYDQFMRTESIPKVCKKWEETLLSEFTWKEIFILPKRCCKDIKLQDFQFKFLHRMIYSKKELFKMKLVDNMTCNICSVEEDSIIHAFYECPTVLRLWTDVEIFLKKYLRYDVCLDLKVILFGLQEAKNFALINHVILACKRHIYVSRIRNETPSFDFLIGILKDTYKVELYIARMKNQYDTFYKKWFPLCNILS